MKNKTINANGTEIRLYGDIVKEDAYICITDIAKMRNPASFSSHRQITNFKGKGISAIALISERSKND